MIRSGIVVAAVLAVLPAMAQSSTPAHTPEWTNPTQGDPGVKVEAQQVKPQAVDSVVDELQGIVVLCAKDSNSPEFKRAWMAYVKKHDLKGGELQATIRKVVNEAFRHRQQFGQQQSQQKRIAGDWKNDTSKAMHDTAMAVIRKIG